MMGEKIAQTSLELLMLLGGAIIVAAIAGFVIKNIYNTGANPLLTNARNQAMNQA